MYEHAYHIDFGANAKAYIEAFMRNLDWKAVQARYEDACKVEPPRPLVQEEFGDVPAVPVEEVKAMIDAGTARSDHRCAPAVLRFSHAGHHGRCPVA